MLRDEVLKPPANNSRVASYPSARAMPIPSPAPVFLDQPIARHLHSAPKINYKLLPRRNELDV